MLGVALALAAAVGFGATAFFARLSVDRVSPPTATVVSLVVGALGTFVVVLALEGTGGFGLSAGEYALIFLAGVSSFLGGRLLNFVSVSKIGVARSSPVVGAAPLVAISLAMLFANETPNALILLGSAAIVVGVVVALTQ